GRRAPRAASTPGSRPGAGAPRRARPGPGTGSPGSRARWRTARAGRPAPPGNEPARGPGCRRSARAWRSWSAGWSWALQQPREEGLLGVQAVLGLLPDHAVWPVDDVRGDLLAAVGRQAVQDQA